MKKFAVLCAFTGMLSLITGCGGSGSDTPDFGRVESVSPTTIDATNPTLFSTTVGPGNTVPAFARLRVHGPGIAKDLENHPRFVSLQRYETDPRYDSGPCFATGAGEDDLECHLYARLKDGFMPSVPYTVRITDGSQDAGGAIPTVTIINYNIVAEPQNRN